MTSWWGSAVRSCRVVRCDTDLNIVSRCDAVMACYWVPLPSSQVDPPATWPLNVCACASCPVP